MSRAAGFSPRGLADFRVAADCQKNFTKDKEGQMKVRELQEELNKLDPELEVLCCSEDQRLLAEGRGFILFDVSAVNTAEAETFRLDDETPYLKLGKVPGATAVATLEVTSDF